MNKAMKLAYRGLGQTRPNPPVGAVLVSGGRKVSEGYHSCAGKAHAEAKAISRAGTMARGATLYVTLEPCSTTGRTPPCTEAIIRSGIRRVVIAAEDSNPVNRGKAQNILRGNGISVDTGCMKDDIHRMLQPYIKWSLTGIPFVTLKLGMTIDGKIADYRYHSKWITGVESREMVGKIRRKVDVVLVGSGTATRDNPGLTDGLKCKGRLLRVVVDTRGSTPPSGKIFRADDPGSTIIATTAMCCMRRQEQYRQCGATVWRLQQSGGMVSLKALMKKLGVEGVHHVLCEGGGILTAGLMEKGLIDEYLFFLAPSILGGDQSRPAVGGRNRSLSKAIRLDFANTRRIGQDLAVTAFPGSQVSGVRGSVVSQVLAGSV